MNEPHRQILSWIVEQYDEHDQPVTTSDAATYFEKDIETIRACFEYLESNQLLASVDTDGYRPTITARELLELDIDDETLLILDTDSERE